MMHRLITWKRGVVDPQTNDVAAPAVGQAWELDGVGNWDDWIKSAAGQPDVVEQREHSNLHALTGRLIDQGQPTVLAYDDNGNQADDGEQFLFEYDANDKLQRVRNRGDNSVVAEYRYDVFGRRVQKEVLAGNPLNAPVGVTRYYYTGQRIAEERDGDDAVVAFYTYGSYIDEPLTMDRLDVAQPPPAVYVRHYFHHNRMFSTYALTDDQGAVAERYTYEAYGKVTTFDANYANPQEVSRVGNPFTFTGRELDPETGLMDYRARTYGPVEGRFKQTDPIGIVGDLNLYRYAVGRPLLAVDPDGELAYVVIYYTGDPDPSKGPGMAFKSAAETWMQEVQARNKWDNECDYVIAKPVLTKADFVAAWNDIDATVKARLANPKKYMKSVPVDPAKPDGDKKEQECECDERIALLHVFSHSSYVGNPPGLEFKPGTVAQADIARLPILDWDASPGVKLWLHGCNTGVPTETGPRGNRQSGPAVAEMFRNRQGVTVAGEKDYTKFSKQRNVREVRTSTADAAYLHAYEGWLNDYRRMSPAYFFRP